MQPRAVVVTAKYYDHGNKSSDKDNIDTVAQEGGAALAGFPDAQVTGDSVASTYLAWRDTLAVFAQEASTTALNRWSAACQGGATSSASPAAASSDSTATAVPEQVVARLCTLVPAAVRAATSYYAESDPKPAAGIVEKASALLAGQSAAAIRADDIASSYEDYRHSLGQGPETTLAAFTRWHDACGARGLPLA